MSRPTHEDVIENLGEGVVAVATGDAMPVTVFSQRAETLTGLSRARAMGRPIAEIFKKDPWVAALLQKTLAEGKSFVDVEETLHRGFSGPLKISAATFVQLSEEGTACGAALLIRDMTGVKELEAEGFRKERLSYIGSLAANLAHEIKNPLLGIRGAAQILDRRTHNDDQMKELAGVIVREADRLNKIVNEMLDFARPRKLVKTSVNVHRVIDDVALVLDSGEEKGKKRAKIIKEFDPSLPNVSGDEDQLKQVFMNLIKNAIEASKNNDTVRVVTRMVTDFKKEESGAGTKFVSVEIIDSGSGMSEETQKEIFTPFYTTKAGGSGLGLSITLRIVNEHGGLIKIDSRQGSGTRVSIFLKTES
jgi:two-component system nitrogen regulation sensor histidine kinase GlnL